MNTRWWMLLLLLPSLALAGGNDWIFHVMNAHGPRRALDNPAELGAGRNRLTIEIPGGGMTASNNSFSVRFWNSRIAGDAYWDRSETRQILGHIPASGLELQAEAVLPAIGVQWRNFAVNVQALATARMSVPKDAATLALVGNQLSQSYSLSDLVGQTLAITDYSLAYGRIIPQSYLPELSGGASVHYYYGLVYTDTRNSTADLLATEERIAGSGSFENISALSGRGFGVDLGLAAQITPRLKAGLAVQRLGARMSWSIDETQQVRFQTQNDGLIIDSLDNDSYTDRVFTQSDTTLKGGRTTLRLPPVARLSGLYQINPRWSAGVLWTVRTGSSPFGKVGHEAGVMTGYQTMSWLTVEGGLLLGGPHRSLFCAGAGVRLGHYELDLGFASAGGLFTSARGMGISVGQRIAF
jgi:hypothetical protein